MRLTRKTNSSELRRFGDSSYLHSRRWKRLCPFGDVHDVSGKRGRLSLVLHGDFRRVGVGSISHGLCARSRASRFVFGALWS